MSIQQTINMAKKHGLLVGDKIRVPMGEVNIEIPFSGDMHKSLEIFIQDFIEFSPLDRYVIARNMSSMIKSSPKLIAFLAEWAGTEAEDEVPASAIFGDMTRSTEAPDDKASRTDLDDAAPCDD